MSSKLITTSLLVFTFLMLGVGGTVADTNISSEDDNESGPISDDLPATIFSLNSSNSTNIREDSSPVVYTANSNLEKRAFYDFERVENRVVMDYLGSWPGTLINGATTSPFTPSGNGNSLDLDGQDDYMSVNPQLLNDIINGTIEANIYLNSLNSTGGAPILAKDTEGDTGIIFNVNSDGTLAAHMGTSLYLHTAERIPLQTWTKVKLTWDGSQWNLYINDQLNASALTTAIPRSSNYEIKIGRHNHPFGPFYLDGYIEDLNISDSTPPVSIRMENNNKIFFRNSGNWINSEATDELDLNGNVGIDFKIAGVKIVTLINNLFRPADGKDNVVDLGDETHRWRNIYLGGDAIISGAVKARNYFSADGTIGFTGNCTVGTQIEVKNGLITNC